jgi:hypothetical protein
MEPLTDVIGLRRFDLGLSMLDIIDGDEQSDRLFHLPCLIGQISKKNIQIQFCARYACLGKICAHETCTRKIRTR